MKNKLVSDLVLQEMLFDEIRFKRIGLKNNNDPKFTFEYSINENKKEDEKYLVILGILCEKKDEYEFTIKLRGYFTFDSDSDLDKKEKDILIKKNTASILMPYIRSQVSLLTAQPNVDCIVLPPLNINNIIDNMKKVTD